MSVYVVALIGNPELVEEKIKELWPTEYHKVAGGLFFLAPRSPSSVGSIRDLLQIGESDDHAMGVVVKMHDNEVAGILPMESVEWYKEAQT